MSLVILGAVVGFVLGRWVALLELHEARQQAIRDAKDTLIAELRAVSEADGLPRETRSYAQRALLHSANQLDVQARKW